MKGAVKWPSALVRSTFIDYFVSHGYTHVPSCSVRPPHGDKSLLFVNAGMNQFKPIFLDQSPLPDSLIGLKSAANSQKCIRVGGKHNDLSHVGRDGTHHTFFEMLGHWSFRDHVPRAMAVEHAWRLLTDVYGLPKERLFVTCFEGNEQVPRDDEAMEIWSKIGIDESMLRLMPASENFWEMGTTGPCGPCTEIHYSWSDPPDFRASKEIWNIVSIQYDRNEAGELARLPASHIDTGLGLERLCAVLQGVDSNYETDLFTPMMESLRAELTYLPPYRNRYGMRDVDLIDQSYRLLADHSRSIIVGLSDGVQPGHQDEGRVIKSLIYRSVNKLLRLGGRPSLLTPLCATAADVLGPTFPEVTINLEDTLKTVRKTAEKCHKNLTRGRRLFRDKIVPRVSDEGRLSINADELNLLKLRGLPEDVIVDIATDRGLKIEASG